MKKRVLAGIMMAVMMMASVMGVSAANSKDTSVKVDGDFVAEKVEDQSIATSAAKESVVAGKTSISAVYEVKAADGKTPTPEADGSFAVTLTVASLSDKCTNIVVLCFDDTTNAWRSVKVEAKNINYENKTISVKLPVLGQIVVFADVATSGAAGTSPSTVGTSSTWMLYLAVAFFVVGAGVVATQKKSR